MQKLKRVFENTKKLFKQPKQKEIRDFLLRARKQAVTIEDLNGLSADIDKFSVLDKVLENKRVFYLGE